MTRVAATWQEAPPTRPPRALLAIGVGVVALVLLPVAGTLFQAAQVSAAEAVALLWRPLVGLLLINTVGLAVATTLVCGVVGTASAWLV
ncbi:MAG: hypothetical protein ACREF3_17105, partial [Acetobacteraceae bacterium]